MPKSHISERERILSEHGETEQIEFGRLRGNTNATNGSRRLSTSSSQSSSLSSTHLKYTYEPEIPNIEEVDETNIDQVLNFPSIAYIPQTFLTEIKQDALYETILEELNKKTSHFTKTHQQHQPQLSDITDDDDESYVYGEGGIIERNEDDMTDEYDTDIEQEQPVQEDHDFTGKSHYREVCDNLKIIPCKYFMAHIEDRELILRYHQFSTDDIRAIAKVMWSNINVEKLFLDGNYLQQAAAKYISRMIVTNDFITELVYIL
ncbi:unnamed protein product [Didymodactylos carnosus]|uniref:Uncharacterized protein n=1 Tax=Didymodactylos carnosus TaxID=1234261 RepID=A0A8S2H2P3_9BILA|nr:unnamed protein product [Didymodactylos carnosus]CAF3591950.1 unnamed protein product [Didymodactylos carnosus]